MTRKRNDIYHFFLLLLTENKMTGIAETDIMYAISDELSLIIFKTIATTNNASNSDMFKKKFNLTAKQYYYRISRMMNAGLIKKRKRQVFFNFTR